MTTKTQTTQTPWAVHPNGVNIFTATPTTNGRIAIADCEIGRIDEREANAALIVKAVNCHEILVEALEFALSHLEDVDVAFAPHAIKKLHEALDKVKEF